MTSHAIAGTAGTVWHAGDAAGRNNLLVGDLLISRADGRPMSDLIPRYPPATDLSPDERYRAVLSIIELCDFDVAVSREILSALGLLRPAAAGGQELVGADVRWTMESLSTQWT